MKERKIVAIRGYLASGKSTALNNLKLHKKMKDWIFVDFEAIRKMFRNNRKTMVKYADASFFAVLKELVKTHKNIITQETSEEMLMENIAKEIKKNKYKIKTITLIVSPETSYQRAAKRRKAKGMKPRTKKNIIESYNERKLKLDKEKIHLNVDNLSEKQVTNEILKLI